MIEMALEGLQQGQAGVGRPLQACHSLLLKLLEEFGCLNA